MTEQQKFELWLAHERIRIDRERLRNFPEPTWQRANRAALAQHRAELRALELRHAREARHAR
jgi:hypothetical protein